MMKWVGSKVESHHGRELTYKQRVDKSWLASRVLFSYYGNELTRKSNSVHDLRVQQYLAKVPWIKLTLLNLSNMQRLVMLIIC